MIRKKRSDALPPEEKTKRQKEATRRWYFKNQERRKAYNREWKIKNPNADIEKHFRRKYGITLADYDRLLSEQGGVCAICKGPQTRPGRFCVDHLHGTKVVRGLLCHPCNSSLGLVKEKTSVLTAMVEYLGGEL